MTATNIQWDIDMDEVYERLDNMTDDKAAGLLNISLSSYQAMSVSDRHDYACDMFHHCPGALDDFLDLPSEITIPDEITDEDDISDWLSDTYGYCHEGFALSTD